MDVQLTIASKRDHREYDPTPLPDEVIEQILDAGRLAGSARNRQPWTFVVATLASDRARLAPLVYVPPMIASAPLAVGVVVNTGGSAMAGFDAGRAAQNMMLAAWGVGVASCPNGIAQPELAGEVLGLQAGEALVSIVAFGRPLRPRAPERRSVEQWSARANRRPLSSVVRELPAAGESR